MLRALQRLKNPNFADQLSARAAIRGARFASDAGAHGAGNNWLPYYDDRGSATDTTALKRDFLFHSSFFNHDEQLILLRSCLKKLDSLESPRVKRRRKMAAPRDLISPNPFLPDEMYEFEQGHYDGVITKYREMHLTAWPSEDMGTLQPLLQRLADLVPKVKTQTHLLHLSSGGEILPHIDNLDASGSWIMGVSLGSPRVLRMENKSCPQDSFDFLLPPGSVYVQRDALRFEYNHSILKDAIFRGQTRTGGQRLSIMIRIHLILVV